MVGFGGWWVVVGDGWWGMVVGDGGGWGWLMVDVVG